MAENPIKTPLPADLPEDWDIGQTVAPDGTKVGLTEQHGYNYLMKKVNEAQRGVNTLNEAMGTVSGKRVCRFVVGTSANGWTAADCDFLCDGVDDQVEINRAITALPRGGGEVVLLDGAYRLSGPITFEYGTWLHGNGSATQLIRNVAAGSTPQGSMIDVAGTESVLSDLSYSGGNKAPATACEVSITSGGAVRNVMFYDTQGFFIRVLSTGNPGYMAKIQNCTFAEGNGINVVGGLSVLIENNAVSNLSESDTHKRTFLETASNIHCRLTVFNNAGNPTCGKIRLDGLSLHGGTIIANNCITQLELLNSHGSQPQDYIYGDVIAGNAFVSDPEADSVPAVILGVGTFGAFVMGNMITNSKGVSLAIQDLGTNNIVRFNSNDTSSGGTVGPTGPAGPGVPAGGTDGQLLAKKSGANFDTQWVDPPEGGGGTAGVTSFNGRSGAVVSQKDDYTAEDVGARPDTWTPSAADVGAIPAGQVKGILLMTQAQYDALTAAEKDAGTLYLIKE